MGLLGSDLSKDVGGVRGFSRILHWWRLCELRIEVGASPGKGQVTDYSFMTVLL